jgi:hypothetical protein
MFLAPATTSTTHVVRHKHPRPLYGQFSHSSSNAQQITGDMKAMIEDRIPYFVTAVMHKIHSVSIVP